MISNNIPFINSNLIGGIAAPIMYDKLGMRISAAIFIIVFTGLATACARVDFCSSVRRSRQGKSLRKDVRYELLTS